MLTIKALSRCPWQAIACPRSSLLTISSKAIYLVLHVSRSGSLFLLVFHSINRFGAHSQPAPPPFEPFRLAAITITGDHSGQAKCPGPPTGPFSEARCPGSLSSPRSSAEIWDLVFNCAEDVEEDVVNNEEGPWANRE